MTLAEYHNPAAIAERKKARARAYYLANRKRILDRGKLWDLKNRDRIRKNRRKLYLENKEGMSEKRRVWQRKNLQKCRAACRSYAESEKGIAQRKRYRKTLLCQIGNRLRNRIRSALRERNGRKAYKTQELIGCSVEFLRNHLESQFQAGMSWAVGNLWHIDHRVPIAAFDMADPEQQKACFHYTNLQPLWAVDNIKKGSRYGQNFSSPT